MLSSDILATAPQQSNAPLSTSMGAPDIGRVAVVRDGGVPSRQARSRTSWTTSNQCIGLILKTAPPKGAAPPPASTTPGPASSPAPSLAAAAAKATPASGASTTIMEVWVHPPQRCSVLQAASRLRSTVESHLIDLAAKMQSDGSIVFTHDYRKKHNLHGDPSSWAIWEVCMLDLFS